MITVELTIDMVSVHDVIFICSEIVVPITRKEKPK